MIELILIAGVLFGLAVLLKLTFGILFLLLRLLVQLGGAALMVACVYAVLQMLV